MVEVMVSVVAQELLFVDEYPHCRNRLWIGVLLERVFIQKCQQRILVAYRMLNAGVFFNLTDIFLSLV